MACLMNYILKNNHINSSNISIEEWPIITDDNFEAANFILEDSKNQSDFLVDLLITK